VPWVLRLPGGSPGRVSDRVVSLIDVAPTILAAVGVDAPETMLGDDVLSRAFPKERPVFSETEIRIGGIPAPRRLQRAVRLGDTKQIQRISGPECYDLSSDGAEQRPSCDGVAWQDRAAEDIERWSRENESLAAALGEAPTVELDEEQQERLRAIGYVE